MTKHMITMAVYTVASLCMSQIAVAQTPADKQYIMDALKMGRMYVVAKQAKACGIRSPEWLENITSLMGEVRHGFALQAHVSEASEAKTNTIIAAHMPTAMETDFASCKRWSVNPDLAVLDEIYLHERGTKSR